MKEEEFIGLQIAKEKEKKENSLLDRESDEYIENAGDEYRSPFDDEQFYSPPDEEESEEDETDIELRENRIKTYCLILLFIYGAFLGLGWYMTRYKGSTPQVLTFEIRDQQVYMEKMDDYIISIQNLYAEGMGVVEQFEGKTLGSKEAVLKLQKVAEKLQKKKDELADQTPPTSLEAFHSKLGDLYSMALSFCNAAEAYATNPTQGKTEVAREANAKYVTAAEALMREYDAFFASPRK